MIADPTQRPPGTQSGPSTVNWKKIALFLAIAYGISWSVALVVYLLGVRLTSIAGIIAIAVGYMPAPAFAAWIVQKGIHRASLREYGLHLRGTRVRGLLWSITVVWVVALGVIGLAALLGNVLGWDEAGRATLDRAQVTFNIVRMVPPDMNMDTPSLPDIPIPLLLAVALVGGSFSGGLFNLLFTFGEELGWRGLLQTELAPLGRLRSIVFTGVVWGIWHAPVILQGHNYREYAWSGVVMMTIFTTAAAGPLARSRDLTGTILGPSVLHAVLNAVGPLPVLFVTEPHPLVGSTPGLFGSAIFFLITWITWPRRAVAASTD